MRKIISLLLVLSMLLSLAACTGSAPRVTIIEKAVTEEQYEEVLEEIEQEKENQNNSEQGGEQQGGTTNNTTPSAPAIKNNPMVLGTFYRNVIGADIEAKDASTKEIDKKADEMLKKIENYPDKVSVTGKKYYLSN